MESSAAILNKSVKSRANGSSGDSKHFTSLQIFTNYAEPALNEYLTQKDQQELEQKQRDEEDKLYRYKKKFFYGKKSVLINDVFSKFLERRREEEDNVARMEEEEREVRGRKSPEVFDKMCLLFFPQIHFKKALFFG